MIEVRRSPQRLTTSEPAIDHPKYTGRRPVAQRFDSEPEVLQSDDDETLLADNVPVTDGRIVCCKSYEIQIFRLLRRNTRNLAGRREQSSKQFDPHYCHKNGDTGERIMFKLNCCLILAHRMHGSLPDAFCEFTGRFFELYLLFRSENIHAIRLHSLSLPNVAFSTLAIQASTSNLRR
jgi:hypothetical protein